MPLLKRVIPILKENGAHAAFLPVVKSSTERKKRWNFVMSVPPIPIQRVKRETLVVTIVKRISRKRKEKAMELRDVSSTDPDPKG